LDLEVYPGGGAVNCERVYGGNCVPPTPEVRNRFTAAWTTPWNVLVQATWRYASGVDQIASDFPVDIDDCDYIDLAAIWTATAWLTARVGVNNLFDTDPPIIDDGDAWGNGNTFPGFYDHLGQYWFLGASVHF
jgi:outer membrane receptor protein involved in Fe transport